MKLPSSSPLLFPSSLPPRPVFSLLSGGGFDSDMGGYREISRVFKNPTLRKKHVISSNSQPSLSSASWNEIQGGGGGAGVREEKKERKKARKIRAKMQLGILGRGVIRSAGRGRGRVTAGRWSLVLNLIFPPPFTQVYKKPQGKTIPRET